MFNLVNLVYLFLAVVIIGLIYYLVAVSDPLVNKIFTAVVIITLTLSVVWIYNT